MYCLIAFLLLASLGERGRRRLLPFGQCVVETQMRSIAKYVINGLLGKFGLELRRADSPRLFPTLYSDLIRETMGCYQQLGFSPLPEDERRVALMSNLMGSKISQSIYLLEYLHRTFDVEGAVCEFGCAAGATSALLANEIRDTNKTLWLFDSFRGLPKPSEKDRLLDDILNLGSIERYEGQMSFPETVVRRRLEEIEFPSSRVRIVPGFIEDTIRTSGLCERVAFAYVDFDFYKPIWMALEFLDDALSPRGCIVVDDYGFLSEGARTAVDEFIATRSDRFEVIKPYSFAGPFVIIFKR